MCNKSSFVMVFAKVKVKIFLVGLPSLSSTRAWCPGVDLAFTARSNLAFFKKDKRALKISPPYIQTFF